MAHVRPLPGLICLEIRLCAYINEKSGQNVVPGAVRPAIYGVSCPVWYDIMSRRTGMYKKIQDMYKK